MPEGPASVAGGRFLVLAVAEVALSSVVVLMVVSRQGRRAVDFERFLEHVEPRLRRALVATYGPVDGREAAGDALSWAWEHWDRMAEVRHPVAYLYRVGQSAVRRFGPRPLPVDMQVLTAEESPDLSPELLPALARLSAQQRTTVLLGVWAWVGPSRGGGVVGDQSVDCPRTSESGAGAPATRTGGA